MPKLSQCNSFGHLFSQIFTLSTTACFGVSSLWAGFNKCKNVKCKNRSEEVICPNHGWRGRLSAVILVQHESHSPLQATQPVQPHKIAFWLIPNPKETNVLNKPVEVDSSLHMSNQLGNYQQLHTGINLFLQHIAEGTDPENKSNFDAANVISGWAFFFFFFFSTALTAESGSPGTRAAKSFATNPCTHRVDPGCTEVDLPMWSFLQDQGPI